VVVEKNVSRTERFFDNHYKGALVSKKGLVPNNAADDIFGYKRCSCKLPQAVENWISAENHISEETITP